MMSTHIATFATIFFSMILVNNYVLVQFLGICQKNFTGRTFIQMGLKFCLKAGIQFAIKFFFQIAFGFTASHFSTPSYIFCFQLLYHSTFFILQNFFP